MSKPDLSAVVIGGGIAGLVAARDLALAGVRVTLIEREDVVGGRVRAVQLAGLPVELGAEAYATRGGAVGALIEELGLGAEVRGPRRAPAWAVTARAAHPLPESGALGIPSRPLSSATRRAIGLCAALRVAVEPWLPARQPANDATVADVARARLGARAVAGLVAPVTEGVYSAAPETLAFAAQTDLAAEYASSGSLLRAARNVRATRLAAGGAVANISGGMSRLVVALKHELQELGVTMLNGVTVHAVTRAACGGWTVQWPGAGATASAAATADAVVMAVPPNEVAHLLGTSQGSTTAGSTTAVGAIAVETVALVIDAPQLDGFPRGPGALIRPGHPHISAKALTHATAKWAWLSEATPAGRHIVRLSYGTHGTAPATAQLDDAAAAALALRDAALVLGVSLAPASVVAHARARWSIPAAAAAPTLPPGLVCTGEAVAGTGLASVVPHAREAAHAVLAELTAHAAVPGQARNHLPDLAPPGERSLAPIDSPRSTFRS